MQRAYKAMIDANRPPGIDVRPFLNVLIAVGAANSPLSPKVTRMAAASASETANISAGRRASAGKRRFSASQIISIFSHLLGSHRK
jgi:hypothetical protein